jgi:hypothetical protein
VTILSICQEVAPWIGIATPTAVFSSTEEEHQQLAALANEMGERLARSAEWNVLKRLHTISNGDGEDTDKPLPTDFDRFPLKSELRSSLTNSPLEHVLDHDIWLDRLMRSFTGVIGSWTLLGGEIHFNPAIETGELIKFYYLSNKWAAASGVSQQYFTADSDTFRLNARTLRLSMIAQWKINKGLMPEPHASIAAQALAQDIARDRGPRDIRMGCPTIPRDVVIAYPRSIDV